MKKGYLKVLSGACALALMLTACGGSGGSDSGNTANNTSGSGAQLTYWSLWNSTEGQAKIIQKAADEYFEKTGIKINIEWKGRELKNLIGPALDAGEKIDLFDDDYIRVSKNHGKYTADLTELAAAADFEKHALPVLLDTAKSYTDGKLKVIPYQPYTTGVWYDKTMFEKANITEVPETFEDLLNVCEKLKASGVNPMTCDQGDGNAMLIGYQLARYLGQDKVVEMVSNGGWGQVPEVKKAAEDIQTLFTKGYMSEFAPAVYPAGQNEIGFGESAMVLQASWIPNEIVQNTSTQVDWGFFPWPTVPNGVDGIEASMVGAQGYGIVEKSEHKQEAFDFIMTVVTGDYDLQMAQSVSSIPADTDNKEWPKAVAGAEPYFKNMTKSYLWVVGLQENLNAKDYIQDGIDKLCKGELDAQGFVNTLDAAYK